MTILVRAVGALACVLIAFGVASKVAERFAPEDERNAEGEINGIGMPALAIEFASGAGEVSTFLGKGDGRGDSAMRRKIRRALKWDDFTIVPFYWLLFVGMAVILSRREWPGFAVWLAVFAALCATAGAASDFVENSRTRALLDAAAVTEPLVKSAASASFCKWLLVSLATLALSPVFIWPGDRRALLVGGVMLVAYVLGGALMLFGILGARPRLVQSGFVLSGAGTLLTAFVFIVWPAWVARRL